MWWGVGANRASRSPAVGRVDHLQLTRAALPRRDPPRRGECRHAAGQNARSAPSILRAELGALPPSGISGTVIGTSRRPRVNPSIRRGNLATRGPFLQRSRSGRVFQPSPESSRQAEHSTFAHNECVRQPTIEIPYAVVSADLQHFHSASICQIKDISLRNEVYFHILLV
jgi:hypothetical protein